LPKLLAITVPANQQSIKLLEKLGMKFEKEMEEAGEKLLQYSLSA
jgi:RimJ/RimL family protein N-acetyltransferase